VTFSKFARIAAASDMYRSYICWFGLFVMRHGVALEAAYKKSPDIGLPHA